MANSKSYDEEIKKIKDYIDVTEELYNRASKLEIGYANLIKDIYAKQWDMERSAEKCRDLLNHLKSKLIEAVRRK